MTCTVYMGANKPAESADYPATRPDLPRYIPGWEMADCTYDLKYLHEFEVSERFRLATPHEVGQRATTPGHAWWARVKEGSGWLADVIAMEERPLGDEDSALLQEVIDDTASVGAANAERDRIIAEVVDEVASMKELILCAKPAGHDGVQAAHMILDIAKMGTELDERIPKLRARRLGSGDPELNAGYRRHGGMHRLTVRSRRVRDLGEELNKTTRIEGLFWSYDPAQVYSGKRYGPRFELRPHYRYTDELVLTYLEAAGFELLKPRW